MQTEQKIYSIVPDVIANKYQDDKQVVRFYFSFSCQYCKRVHNFIRTWGQSLPSGMRYIETPVISNTPSSKMLAYAYEFVKANAKTDYYVEKYTTNIYKHIHKIQNTDELSRLIKEAMDASKINTDAFMKRLRTNEFLDYMKTINEQQIAYAIDRTPSIVIGNKYITHLEYVKGDTSKFIELINAVTNIHLMDGDNINE